MLPGRLHRLEGITLGCKAGLVSSLWKTCLGDESNRIKKICRNSFLFYLKKTEDTVSMMWCEHLK